MYLFSCLEFFNLRHLIKLYSCKQYYQPVWSVPGTKNDKRCGSAHSVGSTLFWKAYCRAENKDCRGFFSLLWCRIWNEGWKLEAKINRKCHWSPVWSSYSGFYSGVNGVICGLKWVPTGQSVVKNFGDIVFCNRWEQDDFDSVMKILRFNISKTNRTREVLTS